VHATDQLVALGRPLLVALDLVGHDPALHLHTLFQIRDLFDRVKGVRHAAHLLVAHPGPFFRWAACASL